MKKAFIFYIILLILLVSKLIGEVPSFIMKSKILWKAKKSQKNKSNLFRYEKFLKICEILDIEFPLLAFSHCRDVVVAVSKAGGMGVFGAVNLPPDRLEEELNWIDDHIDGKPYGIDLIVPNKYEGKGKELKSEDIIRAVPQEHKTYANSILESHDFEVLVLKLFCLAHLVGFQCLFCF